MGKAHASDISRCKGRARSWLLPMILILSACNWGYGESVDRAGFDSAVLHEDGTRCVFALHDVVYRPAEGLRAFPDGGIPRYDIDRHKLGVVDVHSGKVNILVDEKNRHWLNGQGGFHVTAVQGRWALIGQGGQRSNNDHDHLWWQLDLDSGALSELLLEDEMTAEGRTVGWVTLADGDFSLIFEARQNEGPQEIWSRTADGKLRRLATTDHYYGIADGQIWWYDVGARAGARTDYLTGATVRERRANFALPQRDPTSGCNARFDHSELIFQTKIDGSWKDRPIPLHSTAFR